MTYELANVMPAPAKPKRRWLLPTVVAIVVVLGAGTGLLLWLNRDITVHGVIQLSNDDMSGNPDCTGRGRLADVTAGAQVTVTDPGGDVVAFATLAAGNRVSFYECDFSFTVTVPAGRDIYAFGVGQHGAVRVAEGDLGQPVMLAFK